MKLKKKYGQHLLSDSRYLLQMFEKAGPTGHDRILEIGPGTGLLTKTLLPCVGELLAVEIDRDFSPYLSLLEKEYAEKFRLVYGDILHVDLEDSIGTEDGRWKVFANIPYYITTPIIEYLLERHHLFSDIYLTVQKEVAQRVCSSGKNKNRSSFTLFVEYYAEPSFVFEIPAQAFTPPPEVDSAFIHLRIRSESPLDMEFSSIEPLIRHVFIQKRKTLRNSLKSFPGVKKLDDVFGACNISPTVRPESLSLEDFARIAKFMSA